MKLKKIISLLTALAVFAVTVPVLSVSADDGFVIENGVLTDYTGEGGHVVIPDSVTSIENAAFEGCTNLISVTIPDGIVKINKNTFYKCTALESVKLPGNLTEICENAFSGCKSLTNVVLPQTLTTIGGLAFAYCDSLGDISVHDGVTKIASDSFYGSEVVIVCSGTSYAWQYCREYSVVCRLTSVDPNDPYAPVIGDVDIDGRLTLSDASLTLKFIAGWNGISVDESAADIDYNGTINLTDVSKMLKIIAGWKDV